MAAAPALKRVGTGAKSTNFLSRTQKHMRAFTKHPPLYFDPNTKQSFVDVAAAFIVFYIAAFFFDFMIAKSTFVMQPQPLNGCFLIIYIGLALYWRVREAGHNCRFYEALWGCNAAIILAGLGCILGRPLLIGIAIMIVGTDQILWYVDVLGYFALGKFPIGVAQYIVWPQISVARKVTTMHHLWFLPFCLWCLWRGNTYFHPYSYIGSAFLNVWLVIAGRCASCNIWFPITATMKVLLKEGKSHCIVNDKETHFMDYMNLNCSYELWSDVKIPFLHWFDDSPPYYYIPFMAVVLNTIQLLPFFLLRFVSTFILGA